MKNLQVNEIFYSVQGEGGLAGTPMIFIRLSGCNLKCSFCDTEHETGREMSVDDIMREVVSYPCRTIVWTGGEPLLQLNYEILTVFKEKGYKQCLETNGTIPPGVGFDYITVSPKVGLDSLHTNFEDVDIDEIRYPVGQGVRLPPAISELPHAKSYFVSPIFVDGMFNKWNTRMACLFIIHDPGWRLSIQVHKLIGIK